MQNSMILHLDLISGISGDMCLGALVDLGVDPEWIQAKLTPVFKGFSIQTEVVFRNALRAVDLTVTVNDRDTCRNYADIRTLIESSGLPPAARSADSPSSSSISPPRWQRPASARVS